MLVLSRVPPSSIRFPILLLRGGHLHGSKNLEACTVGTSASVENGYFENLLLIDAEGQAFLTQSASVVKEPYFQRPKTPFGRGVRVELSSLLLLGVIELESLKALVLERLQSDEYWAAREDLERISTRVRQVRSHSEVYPALYGSESGRHEP